ncbi:MAG: hypothetical protein JWM47_3823, partial [Acidimicrobiales bacterium]|nr:hypothetical protein [Acidimicrobiales bacterium]
MAFDATVGDVERPLSPAEAAEALGVSPSHVRRLIGSGDLRAERFGRAWMVDRASVNERRAMRPRAGRPPSSAAAWRLVLAAEPAEVEDLASLAVRARRRADPHRGRTLPAALEAVDDDPRLVLSGPAAAVEHGAAAPLRDERDVYVRRSEWEDVQRAFRIRPAVDDANITVRVVDDAVWPFDQRAHLAPP